MAKMGAVFLLAGAREAHEIAAGLDALGRDILVSLPEPERGLPAFPVPVDFGGFVDAAAFATRLNCQPIRAVIDASHGFDAQISTQAHTACTRLGIAYLRVLRPQWRAGPRDHWQEVPHVAQAQSLIGLGARVFSTTGRASLKAYQDFPGAALFLRQTEQHKKKPPWPFVHYVPGKPPFSVADEVATFQRLNIDQLIFRNMGGQPGSSKIEAARQLGLPVIMIARPGPPDGPTVATAKQALSWEACL